jgi:hypothetical protein
MNKIYLCRECGHAQESPHAIRVEDESWDSCEMCEAVESLDIYVKTEKPNPKLKTWRDKLAWKRAHKE